ncbi:hypothetical protein C8R48DRAFT_776534 [Suillus tomentosus]|nr:hypothetical protein C8R48DRAFT_776534 [Suillus tomentosus]
MPPTRKDPFVNIAFDPATRLMSQDNRNRRQQYLRSIAAQGSVPRDRSDRHRFYNPTPPPPPPPTLPPLPPPPPPPPPTLPPLPPPPPSLPPSPLPSPLPFLPPSPLPFPLPFFPPSPLPFFPPSPLPFFPPSSLPSLPSFSPSLPQLSPQPKTVADGEELAWVVAQLTRDLEPSIPDDFTASRAPKFNAKRRTTHAFDDAGISITKTILPPPGPRANYDMDPEPPNILKTVPPLVPTTPHSAFRRDVVSALVRALLPVKNKDSQPYFVSTVNPRLLATLAQIMHPLPEEFRDYDIPLSDVHLPLLQRVPSRENFCFKTLLALPYCKEVCDDTIGVIRHLNTLRVTALDIKGTIVGSYGLTVLARGLSWSDDELQSRTGCWGLRILSLHSCTNIGNEALPILSKFPLLSSIDLRFTGCTRHAVSKYLADAGFRPSSNRLLFHPAPLEVSLKQLENLSPTSMYSCGLTSVFKLHVNKLNYSNLFSEHGTPSYILQDMMERPISLIDVDVDEENSELAEPTSQNMQASTTSMFYASRLPRRENLIRAAAKEQLHPLTLARPPPQWSVLHALRPPVRQQQLYGPKEDPPPLKLT